MSVTVTKSNTTDTMGQDMTKTDTDQMIARLLPEPTTDARVIEVYTGVLQAAAIAAASAVGEIMLRYFEMRDRGETYTSDPVLLDELGLATEKLDLAWRGYVRRVGKSAGPVVAEAVESYLGSDVAFIVEHGLDAYRRECLPGYAASQDFWRERARRDAEAR